MKVHVAGPRESLQSIAKKYGLPLSTLRSMNPTIAAVNQPIVGKAVHLPQQSPSITFPFPLTAVREAEYSNNWLPLVTPEAMAQTHYDVLIVGSGAGGSAALWRLAARYAGSGKRIGLVEAGADVLPTAPQNLPVFDESKLERLRTNPLYSISYPATNLDPLAEDITSQPPSFSQFIALGGQTLVWSAVCPRMAPEEIAAWPIEYRELENYYHIAEQAMLVSSCFARDSVLQREMLKQLWRAGMRDAGELPLALDLNPTKYGLLHTNPFYNSIIFIAKAMNLIPLDIAVQARAAKVIASNSKAQGLLVIDNHGKPYAISASKVILAAGAIETPRLLLNSGIGSEAVGHYLTSASLLTATGVIRAESSSQVSGVASILIPQAANRPYQLKLEGPGSGVWHPWLDLLQRREDHQLQLTASGRVESRHANAVTIDPYQQDRFGIPRAVVHFAFSEKDWKVIDEMADAVLAAGGVLESLALLPEDEAPLELLPPGSGGWAVGTCRMGVHPSSSVTDSFSRLHGVSGLFIADASAVPTTGAADPALTIIALAIRTADYIAAELDAERG